MMLLHIVNFRDLSFNNLSGQIPPALFNLSQLSFLYFTYSPFMIYNRILHAIRTPSIDLKMKYSVFYFDISQESNSMLLVQGLHYLARELAD